MSSNRSANSSDGEAARQAAARLRGEKRAAPSTAPAPVFVAFSAAAALGATPGARPVAAAPAAPPPPAAQSPAPSQPGPQADVPPPPPGASAAQRWDHLLDWCLTSAGARAAFVLEAQGLLVASRGLLPFEDVQGLGGRLMVALEQAGRMASEDGLDGGAVSVELGGRWLSGFSLPFGGSQVTLALLSAEPIQAGLRTAIAAWVEAAFAA